MGALQQFMTNIKNIKTVVGKLQHIKS